MIERHLTTEDTEAHRGKSQTRTSVNLCALCGEKTELPGLVEFFFQADKPFLLFLFQ